MADIRIKDLAVTAGSSASDDYLAVDGSTNGTRKLNAYSPTFGGNVVATGTLTVNSTTDSSSKDTGAIITEGGLGVEKSATIGGNLTVSGTGTSTFSGPVTLSNTASTASYQTGLRLSSTVAGAPNTVQSLEFFSSSLGVALAAVDALRESGSYASSLRFWSTTGPGVLTENMRLTSGGNFLIGTTTDTGAKVYSKVADGVISFGAAGTTKGIRFAHASTYSSIDGVDSSLSGSYQPLQINGSTVQIATNGGTVAASFDISQNATFAGTVSVSKSGAGSTIQINADSGYGSKLAMQRASTNRWTLEVDGSDVLTLNSLGTTAALTMVGTTSATFAGFVSSNQGYVAKGTISIPSAAYVSLESSGSVGYLTSYNGAGSAYLPMNYRASKHNFANGGVNMSALPTSASGLSSGDLWNDSGTLKIV